MWFLTTYWRWEGEDDDAWWWACTSGWMMILFGVRVLLLTTGDDDAARITQPPCRGRSKPVSELKVCYSWSDLKHVQHPKYMCFADISMWMSSARHYIAEKGLRADRISIENIILMFLIRPFVRSTFHKYFVIALGDLEQYVNSRHKTFFCLNTKCARIQDTDAGLWRLGCCWDRIRE